MRKTYQKLCLAVFAGLLTVGTAGASDNNHLTQNNMTEKNLTLTQEWDKVFPLSDKVEHSKVTFHNRYGITLAADLYIPKGASGTLAVIDGISYI